jgi:GNAT superfamily N-acetyltransferase
VDIRTLTTDRLDGALALSTLMGWNQRLEDWRTLIALAPSGSFVAFDGDRVVATAIGLDYVHCGWIAMMLVAPEYRGRGLGARLLEAAMSAIPPQLPIRLDATPLGRPLYEHYDFAHERALTRHVRPAGAPALAPDNDICRLKHVDLEEVKRIDAALFGGVRAELLERILTAAPDYARAVHGDSLQYCMGRSGRLFDQIGPVVATDTAAAIALAAAALPHAHGRAVVVDAYDSHAEFTEWLQSAGFEAQRPLYRMRRAAAAPAELRAPSMPQTEFAILGPEFG